jgi:oligopeptide/dipeptide ABC transporter ATP-binding protein
MPRDETLLEARGLRVTYRGRRGLMTRTPDVHSVDGVDLSIGRGETLGVVGESGCGKSTLGRAIVGLGPRPEGGLTFDGEDLTSVTPARRRELSRQIQMVFQDATSALNPRRTVEFLVSEGWRLHPGMPPRSEWREQVTELVGSVGLGPETLDRYPHELSGGQRQRVVLARAVSMGPRLVVCDEPVSALDVSVQAQTLNLLADLKSRLDLSYLFISHDLAVVRHVSDRIAVMYLGQIVEVGSAATVAEDPRHPYTLALLSAEPDAMPWRHQRQRIVLGGDLPSPAAPPSGCRFRTRCPMVQARCAAEAPELRTVAGREVACHFAESAPALIAGVRS